MGSFFRRIFRFLLPILGNAGQELTREGISTGVRVLGDLAEGKTLRNSLVNGTSEGLKNIVRRTNPSEGLVNLIGKTALKLQKGGGRVRAKRMIESRRSRQPVIRASNIRGRRSVPKDQLEY